ncbi:MAG: rhodanese-like domain-containing protein [Parcubacteria group bacterium]|jgi:rhodanese-related sulfurtransferase
MKKTDKNIIVALAIIIVGLLVWTMTRYTTIKNEKDAKDDTMIETSTKSSDTEISNADETPAVKTVIPQIDAKELSTKILTDRAHMMIIDMRDRSLFDAGHIAGSYPINDIASTQLHDTIILVTATGDESTIISYYKDITPTNNTVFNLSGGIAQWTNNGYSLIAPTTEQTFANTSKVQFVEPRDVFMIIKNLEEMKKTVILDTRRPGNFATGHIAGSINIPFSELEYHYDTLPSGYKIFVYGANDTLSFEAGALLYDLNFINTKTIKGGFDAWEKYNYPVVK